MDLVRRTLTVSLLAGALTATAVAGGTDAAPSRASEPEQPNPYLSQGTDRTAAGLARARSQMTEDAAGRATSPAHDHAQEVVERGMSSRPGTIRWKEREPRGQSGRNDIPVKAERIQGFGTSAGHTNAVRITGGTARPGPVGAPTQLPPAAEDDGSIPTATDTGLRASGTVTTTGVLGDGPHGPDGDATNDFDFYALDIPAGNQVVADTSGSDAAAGAGIIVYDASGNQRAFATQPGATPGSSRLTYTPRRGGRHYVAIAGTATPSPFPVDPFDSGSGTGGAATGTFALSLTVQQADSDHYAVRLRAGDVLGATVDGSADTVRVTGPGGSEVVGTTGVDYSPLYPPASPLPGGGNAAVAHVAKKAGWYVLGADGAPGRYQLQVEAYRPGTEGDRRPQTVFLDFEGGRVDTRPWGGKGVRTLSPFSSFLDGWDIPRKRGAAMTRAVTRQVRAALVHEVERHGPDPDLAVRVVSSRTHPELRDAEGVTRVVVAGTVEESGVATLGTSDAIDPGNFSAGDSALVLLDLLSAPAGKGTSLNTWMDARSDREAFVAQAVGNVTAHEVAHTLGSLHTDNRVIDQLMDSGSAGDFGGIFGVGEDGIGGTRDDVNLQLGTDGYAPTEGFTGVQDTANVTGWAYAGR